MVDADVLNDPTRIYNADETGLPLDYKPGNVIGRTGARSVYGITSGKKGQLTVMGCANAAGQVMPPMILHKGKRANKKVLESMPDTWQTTLTESGWMNGDAFLWWLKNVSYNYPSNYNNSLLLYSISMTCL